MKVSMIVAIGKVGQLGLNNQLLWHIPKDLEHFKQITTSHCIIMGRKTFESIGKVLPNRTNIVLSQNNFSHEEVECFDSLNKALIWCEQQKESEVFIIGGAQIYTLAMPLIQRLYLTQVDFEGEADCFFDLPNLSKWNILEEKNHKATVKTPAWKFTLYERDHEFRTN